MRPSMSTHFSRSIVRSFARNSTFFAQAASVAFFVPASVLSPCLAAQLFSVLLGIS